MPSPSNHEHEHGEPSHGSPPPGYCPIPAGEDQDQRHDGSVQLPIPSQKASNVVDEVNSSLLTQGQNTCDALTPRSVVRPLDTAEASLRKLIWTGISLMGACLTFASPGFPFGKYHISYADIQETLYRWPAVAFVLAYVLLFFAFVHFLKVNQPKAWIVVGQALQMFHLFEEHGLEALDARRSPFKRYFNGFVREEVLLQESWSPDCFSDFNILLICLMHGIGLFFLSMWEGPRYGAGVATFGFCLIDGIMHAVFCVFTGFSYNPGVFSAILLVIPAASYYFILVNCHILRGSERNPVTGVGVSSGCIGWFLLLVCLLNLLPSVMCVLAYVLAVVYAEVQMHRLLKPTARD